MRERDETLFAAQIAGREEIARLRGVVVVERPDAKRSLRRVDRSHQ
jgi:hypothetical protein